jgi:seryl-tRNA synthetase
MKARQDDLRRAQSVREPEPQIVSQLTELGQKFAAEQAESERLRAKLDSLQEQSSQDTGRAAALEAKVADLSRQLEQKQTESAEQQELLAHDRDIRELMGARDLYIAEVYDVARSGETQKPFGRVFYTKEKSLIFYAYDLDQQSG